MVFSWQEPIDQLQAHQNLYVINYIVGKGGRQSFAYKDAESIPLTVPVKPKKAKKEKKGEAKKKSKVRSAFSPLIAT